MNYLSRVKLPSGSIYEIKDAEGRAILGFTEYQQNHAYTAGDYVIGSTTGASGSIKLYKVVNTYTSSTSAMGDINDCIKKDVADGNLVLTSVEEELQSAMAGGVGVVHTTGNETISGTKTFTSDIVAPGVKVDSVSEAIYIMTVLKYNLMEDKLSLIKLFLVAAIPQLYHLLQVQLL